MSIERVETICREFLLQSEAPLVPVSLLYQQCIAEEAVREVLTEEALLNFLREHTDVVVVEGVGEDAPVAANEFNQAGLVMGPRAILKSRMPTRDEMKNMFQMQLEVMHAGIEACKGKSGRQPYCRNRAGP